MASDSKFNLVLRAVMAFAFSGMGFYFGYLMLGEIKDGTASVNWPVAPGSITSSSYASENSTGRRGRTKLFIDP